MPKHHLRIARGFTLVELLIAITILSFLVLLLSSLVSAVNRAWLSGERQAESFQDGRAIMEIISRELSQAVISPHLQFIQNPGDLSSLLTGSTTQVSNSESLFWQTVSTGDALGNVTETGYYLTHRVDSNNIEHFELRRFFVPPTDPKNTVPTPTPNSAYHIYDSPTPVIYNTSANNVRPAWINLSSNAFDPPRKDFEYFSSVVSDGVVGLWIRCLDGNGEAIPWSSATDPSTSPIRFNSTAYFQPSIPGQTASFRYTNPGNTEQANQLPAAVELTIIMVDSRTLARKPTIPPIPVLTSPNQIPNAVTQMNKNLITNKISTARTFFSTIRLKNAQQ